MLQFVGGDGMPLTITKLRPLGDGRDTPHSVISVEEKLERKTERTPLTLARLFPLIIPLSPFF